MNLGRKLWWIAGMLAALLAVGGIGFWERPVEFFRGAEYAREYLTGVSNHTVTVEGYRVHYIAEGPKDGPPVVLVHGLGGRAEDWLNLAPYFARAGYRVYMPDLPGYGRSQQPAGFSYSIPAEAGAVVSFLDALNLKQVDLGGWSMGGWIVQQIAVEHAERVRKLMLFDSAGLYAPPKWDTNLFIPINLSQLDQLDALLMPHPPMVPGFIARDILRISRKNAWVIRRALATMLTGKDTTDNLLPELKMPVLIVWGQEDQITPLFLGERIQSLTPGSQLAVIPGCGHLAPAQCAGAIGPKVEAFVRQ